MSQKSLVPVLSQGLMTPEEAIEQIRTRAREELRADGVDLRTLTHVERKAVIAQRMLVVVDRLDTGVYTLKSMVMQEIEAGHLYSHHPENFEDTADMVFQTSGRAMSSSETSDRLAWVSTVRPKLLEMGYDDSHFAEMGKTKIRAIIPVFRVLTGEKEGSESVKRQIEYVRENYAAETDGDLMNTFAEIAYDTVTWDEFQKTLGKFVDTVQFFITPRKEGHAIAGVLTDEQLSILKRRMGRQLDLVYVKETK